MSNLSVSLKPLILLGNITDYAVQGYVVDVAHILGNVADIHNESNILPEVIFAEITEDE